MALQGPGATPRRGKTRATTPTRTRALSTPWTISPRRKPGALRPTQACRRWMRSRPSTPGRCRQTHPKGPISVCRRRTRARPETAARHWSTRGAVAAARWPRSAAAGASATRGFSVKPGCVVRPRRAPVATPGRRAARGSVWRGLIVRGGLCRACGTTNTTCCPGSSCVVGNFCSGGVCRGCGAPNGVCCPGSVCLSGGVCSGSLCCTCGYRGQPCCSGLCSQGSCRNGLCQ